MKTDCSETDLSPSKLQEAIDTIAGEFGYPDSLTIEYTVRPSGEKRTRLTVPSEASTDAAVLVLSHAATSEQPVLSLEE